MKLVTQPVELILAGGRLHRTFAANEWIMKQIDKMEKDLNMKKRPEMSRRGFLKRAALAGAGIRKDGGGGKGDNR